ncbi:glycosyltransferase [Marinobacter sp. HN1S83]|uniref:glycosyltransferase n=1 Tax=Marinobacter sp. HN1S83 TaxID=3382301 RepID=UPI00387AE8F0
MTGRLPSVSILVPAHNEEKHISKCIESLLAQSYPEDRYEIIVVNNRSSDDTKGIACKYPVAVHDYNGVGIGAVRNYAVENSTGEILAFIDADCVAPADWVETAVTKVLSMPGELRVVGGDALMSDEPSRLEKYWFFKRVRKHNDMKNLNGASMIFPKKLFDEVGGFNVALNAGEDSDFSHRIRQYGTRIEYDERLDVIHLGYPKTFKQFCARQFWLASSFIYSNNGLNDLVFLFSLLFLVSTLSLFFGLIFKIEIVAWLSVLGILIGPTLFHYRKMRESSVSYFSLQSAIVYILSIAYFSSRALGLIFSFSGMAFQRRKRY